MKDDFLKPESLAGSVAVGSAPIMARMVIALIVVFGLFKDYLFSGKNFKDFRIVAMNWNFITVCNMLNMFFTDNNDTEKCT